MKQIFSDINGNFYQNKLDCFQQFIGYCLLPTSELQASLVLYGEGSNGKGVLDESIAKAFGRKNVSGEKISSLVSNRFALANLLNKLINIESDGGEISINESSTLKSIISGDEVSIEVKNEQGSGQKVQLYARMLICTNHIPKILDDSAAWDRRIVGITLMNKFGVDPIFKAKTLKNEFLESLIMFAIEGIKKLYDNGRKFFKDEHFEQSLESLKEQLQPIYKYCKENDFFDCALEKIDIKKLFMKGVVYNDLYLDKYKY
jgi:putative DNA primase/helicase